MTEDELQAEHEALMAEHAALEADHKRLERERPRNMDAHLAHARRLKAHVDRLHRYMTERGFMPPTSAK